GKPAVTEQKPLDEDGRPFPTQYYVTCPHLVAAISRLEAAGGVERWTRAAQDDPALAASLADADAEQRRLDARRQPEMPARPRRVRPRAPRLLARQPHRRRAARALARQLLYSGLMDVELARHQWEDGNRRVEALRNDRRRYRELIAEVELVIGELRKRVGQTFTLGELADAYDGADDW